LTGPGGAVNLPPVMTIFIGSLLAYLAGLGCSFTWPGTVVSNLLVTVGMSGIFYVLWQALFKKSCPLARIITWVGIESYAVFLLHGSPLRWTGLVSDYDLHWGLALLVIGLSFPAGALISWCVREVQVQVLPPKENRRPG
jgi:hypothetical protein